MKRRPEPDAGRVELDRDGVAWQRHDDRWYSTISVTALAWPALQSRFGPTEPMEVVTHA